MNMCRASSRLHAIAWGLAISALLDSGAIGAPANPAPAMQTRPGAPVTSSTDGQTSGSAATGHGPTDAQALAEQLAAELSHAGISVSPGAISELAGAIAKGGQSGMSLAQSLVDSVAQTSAGQGDQVSSSPVQSDLAAPPDGTVANPSASDQSSDPTATTGRSATHSVPRKASNIQPVSVARAPAPIPTSRSGLAAGWGIQGSPPAAIDNLPVLSGAVRSSFSSSRDPSTWQERASFNVALSPDVAFNTYALQLASAGWSETSRGQRGDANASTLPFTADLQNGSTHAHLVYAQNQHRGTSVSVTLTTLFPGDSAPSLETGVTATPPTGAATSPLDRGAQDPADFPRLPGSVRTSYSSSSSTQVMANYTAKCLPRQADAFFAQSLAVAGWAQTGRDEAINLNTQSDQITLNWQNAKQRANILITGSTAGGGTVRVILTTRP